MNARARRKPVLHADTAMTWSEGEAKSERCTSDEQYDDAE
jgi:hypothetical protein